MRPWFVLALSVISCFSIIAEAEPEARDRRSPVALSFGDLPRLIRERNENVKAAEATVQASKQRTSYQARSFLPSISATGGAEVFRAGSTTSDQKEYWSLEARVNLYRGGRDSLEGQIREANLRGSEIESAREFSQELKEARQYYWKFVAVSQLIKNRHEALERNDAAIKSARRRAGAGISTTADVMQFELQRTLYTQDLKKFELERDLLRNKLSVAIGANENSVLEIAPDFPHPPDNEPTINPAQFDKNLDMSVLAQLEKSAELESRKASKWWLPTVDIYSSYGLPSLSDEFARAIRNEAEFTAGIQAKFDLFQGFEAQSEASARSAQSSAYRYRAMHRVRELKAEDHELRHDLKLLHELMHDADNDLVRAEKFLNLTQTEYGRGVKNGPDVLEAFRTLFEFRQRRIELYREYHVTRAELLALVATEQE